ncbi:MAG TPA: MarC family protein [Dongiaceae bacterium]|jgi:multiple antibiotic resistance protein|nr:MarC family protein [Dongiaceae bacterium]
MSQVIASFLTVFAGLIPIVNPLGMAPIFLRMTSGASSATRAALAWRVALYGFVLMVGSLFIGSHILAFFGLTLPAIQVAGGLVVMAAGWRLLQEGGDVESRQSQAPVPDEVLMSHAFFPLTLPLTVGPGTMSVAITIGTTGATDAAGERLLPLAIGAIAATLAVAASIYVSYRFAYGILRWLGETGTDIFLRLSAFVLLCLGVQILWNGVHALLSLHAT